MFEYKGIKIAWLGHDGFGIESDKTIYIDPFRTGSRKKADAEEFKRLAGCDVVILKKEEED